MKEQLYNKGYEIVNFILEQDIYYVAALGLIMLASVLVLGIIILAGTLFKRSVFGKVVHIIFLLLLIPEASYLIYWITILIQMETGTINNLPL